MLDQWFIAAYKKGYLVKSDDVNAFLRLVGRTSITVKSIWGNLVDKETFYIVNGPYDSIALLDERIEHRDLKVKAFAIGNIPRDD